MSDIAGISYVEAQFDKNGVLQTQVDLPAEVTDLFVMSHGWNNNAADARELYRKFFENLAGVAQPNDLTARTFAIVGVIWPSKKFDELVAVSGVPGGAEGSASLHAAADAGSRQALDEKLERMKETFAEPAQHRILDEAKALLVNIEEKASARRAFVDMIRSLLDPKEANKEDASVSFFKDDGDELMNNLKVDEADLDEEVAGTGGSASLPLGVGSTHAAEGGAAGLSALLSGFKAAAMNILNFTTYFEMKARAGAVGKNGVAPLIDKLAPQVERIHLIGHSFGGRVVTATAANSKTEKIRSMSLLQTAFSHNGFSKSKGGFFRGVVDQQRVKGPILVTHTKNDKAVGVAYPLASRINGDRTAAFGDENDEFGGLGRNGAQQMQSGETVPGRLLPVGSSYAFQAGKFFNLEASDFIKSHGDVTGKEIAHAVRKAIAG
jgi:hypothetical protein